MVAALRKRGARIGELEAEKRRAVEDEDYDRAKGLKQEIDALYRGAFVDANEIDAQ